MRGTVRRNLVNKLFPSFVLITVWANSLIVASSGDKPKELHYESEKVTVIGKVVSRTFYGPPNYGENRKTDSKESQYILLLDSPIDVIGSKDDLLTKTERGVRSLTLVVFDFKANPVEPLLGSRVVVEGTLFHAHTGHHHTKVLIEVGSIRKLSRPRDAVHPLDQKSRTKARITSAWSGLAGE
jgi:hypothetical protein